MTEANPATVAPGTAEGFDCDVCNSHHDTLPLSLAFGLPDFINKLLPWDKDEKVKMTQDWAIVSDKYYYLRACLEVPINDMPGQKFVWGIWVTISQFDFDSTMEMWDNPERVDEPEYMGTLANTMPSYDETRNLKVLIKTRAVGERPAIIVDEELHRLFTDQTKGVDRQDVVLLAKYVLHSKDDNPYAYLCEK